MHSVLRSLRVMARNSRVPTATRQRPAARYRAPTDPAFGDAVASVGRRVMGTLGIGKRSSGPALQHYPHRDGVRTGVSIEREVTAWGPRTSGLPPPTRPTSGGSPAVVAGACR